MEQIMAKYGEAFKERVKEDKSIKSKDKKDAFKTMASIDPSGAKRTYLEWIIKSYIAGGVPSSDEGLYNFSAALLKFDRIKHKLPLGDPSDPRTNQRNILNYCGMTGLKTDKITVPGLAEVLDAYPDVIPFDKLIFRNHNVSIYKPDNKEEAMHYGRGTRWCTSGRNMKDVFMEYYRRGPLYIFVPADPEYEGEKFQLHINVVTTGFHTNASLMHDGDATYPLSLFIRRFPEFVEIFRQDPSLLGDNAYSSPLASLLNMLMAHNITNDSIMKYGGEGYDPLHESDVLKILYDAGIVDQGYMERSRKFKHM